MLSTGIIVGPLLRETHHGHGGLLTTDNAAAMMAAFQYDRSALVFHRRVGSRMDRPASIKSARSYRPSMGEGS